MASKLQTIDDALHDTAQPWHKIFGWAEARSGVHRLNLFGVVVITVAAYLVSGYGSSIMSNAVGLLYPTYFSLKMIRLAKQNVMAEESNRTGEVSASSRWLTYWLIFSTVLIVEHLVGWILRMLPFYYLLRTVFLVWCFASIDANGAAFMYASIIHRYFGAWFSGIPDN
ncbi:TB2/DP1/HVA22-related protein [Cinara cedri]|uniref:Receptor expression-enhancing protein n=1 Tax=Cinara cedri TaxID=506608 RepID=A0A5E4MNA6_9HEMI|nr:TB2/DP1/HVA22-related protein [Cinara cedri]